MSAWSRRDGGDDDEIEQKFQNTYDEVVALKSLLQRKRQCGSIAFASFVCDGGDKGADSFADLVEDNSGSESAFALPATRMCFSDEMCSFTPEIFETPPVTNHERSVKFAPIPHVPQEPLDAGDDEAQLLSRIFKRETKLSHLRHEEVAKQDAEMLGVPEIARRSAALFEKRDDDLAHCKVEDRLHLLGLIYQYQQEERLLQKMKTADTFHPHVAPHSANLTRQFPLPAHEQVERLQVSSSLQHVMLRIALIRKIALQRGKRRNLLSKRCGCCRERHDASPTGNNHNGGKCKPPCRVDAAHANVIYEKQVQWKHEIERKDMQLRDFFNELAQSECTFKNPYYKEAWNTLSMPSSKRHSASDDDDAFREDNAHRNPNTAFFERSMEWAMKKEQRLQQEKRIWRDIHLSECTFKPKVSPQRRRLPSRKTWKWDSGNNRAVGSLYSGSPFSKRSPPSLPLRSHHPPSSFLTQFVFPDEHSALDLEALAATTSSEYMSSPRRRGSYGQEEKASGYDAGDLHPVPSPRSKYGARTAASDVEAH
ncbi:hypothetical protein FI667_g2066, partial [Globisporangium splendens]